MKLLASIILSMVAAVPAFAAEKRIRITGRPAITVTTDDIRLGDIAEVQSANIEDDEAVIGLKKIWVERAPKPADQMTLSANQILEKVAGQGVDLASVGYTLPRVITVTRAGREITEHEVRSALEAYLDATKTDLAIQSVEYRKAQGVPPGQLQLSVESIAAVSPRIRTVQFAAKVDGEDATRFSVPVTVEEYRDVPVAKRSVARGAVVTGADVLMARLNLASLPDDTVSNTDTLVGLEATHDIASGEVFRNAKLALPHVIEAGAPVTMQYKTDLFEATATGVALEAGSIGQDIKVRNDASKKILVGKVIQQGLVSVK